MNTFINEAETFICNLKIPDSDFSFFSLNFLVIFTVFYFFYLFFSKNEVSRSAYLILASLGFYYIVVGRQFLLIFLGITLLNYIYSYIITIAEGTKKTVSLVMIILTNLSIFAFFIFWLPQNDITFVKIGASFYILQAISFLIDVYKKKTLFINYDFFDYLLCKNKIFFINYNFFDYLLYMCFFPKILSGPITRIDDFIYNYSDEDNFGKNWIYISIGILQTIAYLYIDKELFDGFNSETATPLECLLVVYGYTIKLYCVFAGYSNLARGIAGLLGYDLPCNFNSPLTAVNLIDFWKRWHISLSEWFRDYIYIPLGGDGRDGRRNVYFNCFVVMLLSGSWHFYGWDIEVCLFWGIIHGFALVINHFVKSNAFKLPKFFGWFLTFHFVVFCFAILQSRSLDFTIFVNAFDGFKNIFAIIKEENRSLLKVAGVMLAVFLTNFFNKKFIKYLETEETFIKVIIILLLIPIFYLAFYFYPQTAESMGYK